MSDDLIWTGSLNDPYRLGGHVGLYDTTLRDGEQTVGVVLDPRAEARDRPAARRARDRPDRGRLPARLRRRLGGGRADLGGRPARRDLGLLARRAGRPRGARRARRALLGDRVADLRPQARRDRRLARVDARADHEGDALRCGATAIHAAFFGVDSTRAEPDFYRRVYSSAVEAGAREVVVVDTLGIASPEAVARARRLDRRAGRPGRARPFPRPQRLRRRDRERRRGRARRRRVRPGDDQRHGRAGRQREPRRGRADAARALRRRVEPAARPDPRRLGAGPGAVRATRSSRGSRSPARRSTVARAAPSRASSTTRRRSSRTPRSSSRAERAIVLGKKSGLDSIRIKAAELGLDVPEERHAELLAAVKAARHARSAGSSTTPSSSSSSGRGGALSSSGSASPAPA